MQVCPELHSLPAMIRSAREVIEKALATIVGDLPPSSSVTGTRFSLAARMTTLPTRVDPVKTRWSNGRCEKASPTSDAARHDGHLIGGNTSATRSWSRAAVSGTSSLGLIMARLPAASTATSGESASCTG